MLFRSLPRLGSLLVLIAGTATLGTAQSTLRASGPPVALLGDATNPFAHPAWSPDGTRLAVTQPGYAGLWTVQPDGAALQQITDEAGSGFGFSWSPDGEALLARVSQTDGTRRTSAVKVFDLERGTTEALTDYRRQLASLPQWSADGSAVFLSSRDGLETFMRTMPEETSETLRAEGSSFVTSGRMLASVRRDASGVQTESLVEDRRVINAVASPDRARVAFEIVGGNLFAMNADGSGLTDLGPGHRPTWSPDGRWIAFMRAEDDGHRFTASDLYAIRPDGSEFVALTRTPDQLEMNPSWSPDGRSVAFDDPSEGTVYILPIAQ